MGKAAGFDAYAAGDKLRGLSLAFAVWASFSVFVFASAVAYCACAGNHFHIGIAADWTETVFFSLRITVIGMVKVKFMRSA